MIKTSELIRLLAVVILSATLLGVAGYVVPAFVRLSDVTPRASWNETASLSHLENGSFSEHALLQQRYADTLQTQIIALLEKTLGKGHVEASVQVELDLQQETRQKREPLADTQVAVRQVMRQQEQPAYVDESVVKEEETSYDVASRSEETTSISGAVKRLSVSILIDGIQKKTGTGDYVYQPRSAAEMQRYRQLVEALIGFSPERGDTLSIQNMPFAAPPSFWRTVSVEMAVRFVLLGACLLLTFFLLIHFIFPMMASLLQPLEKGTERGGFSSARTPSASDILAIQRFFREKPETALSLLKNWLYEPSPKNHRNGEYTAQQKAAILLLALGETTIRDVFHRLSEMEVRTLSRLMSQLGAVPAESVRSVLSAFIRSVKEPVALFGTEARVRQVLSDVFSPEKSAAMMMEVACSGRDESIWERLQRLDVSILARYLEAKKPETTALILYHLTNDKAAKVLSLLSDGKAAKVLEALAQLEHISAAERLKLEQDLTQQLHTLMLQARFKSGSEKASDILRTMDHTSEEKLMADMYRDSPQSAERIAYHMICFDDIARWPDSAIQTVLRHTNRDMAALALRGATTAIRDAFARNMPPQVWAGLIRESERMRAPRLSDIERAQTTITKTAQELIYHKKISPFATKG